MLRSAAVAALGLSLVAGSAFAQVNANNLVNVNISNIAVDVADVLDVNENDIAVGAVVQAPIEIAANVCGIEAEVLSQDLAEDQEATCEATGTSEAFNELIQSQRDSLLAAG